MNLPKAPPSLLALTAALTLGAPSRAQIAGLRVRAEVKPAVPAQAALFRLAAVRLLPGPFKDAQETDRAYLLRLDPDRLLSGMRRAAGLTPKAPTYGGWDSGGSGTVGHHLSACAQMAQATGDPALKRRVEHLVSEMDACQKAGGNGGLWSSPWDRDWYADLGRGNVRPENTTPWYTTHKTLAGLRDAYLVDGNTSARDVLVKTADWCVAVTSGLTDAQFQHMLGDAGTMGEFGGPHEVLADVYAITGNRKYLTLAERFKHRVIFDPLARGDASVPDRLYVNLFIPSVLTDRAHGLTLTLTKPRRMTLSLRYPDWVAPGALRVRVNGRAVPIAARPGSFVDVSRLWRTGDRVDMALPMRLTTEPLPDPTQYAAFFYGPVLLAGRLGTEELVPADFHSGGPFDTPIGEAGQTAQKKIPESHVPVFVGTAASALPKIVPVPGKPLTFQTRGLAQPHDVTLVPFYRLFFERYALYWNVLTPGAYARRSAQAAQEQRDADMLEARTVDRVLIGEPASEAAHAFAFDRSHIGGAGAPFTHWRDAKGSFGYTLKVPADQPAVLRCVYWGSDAGRTFDIFADGTKIATQTLPGTHTPNARRTTALPSARPIARST